jgi:transcription elongation factor Elf1
MRQYTHKEFLELLKGKECLNHLEIIGIYENMEKPILVRCKHCNKEYYINAKSVIYNINGCKQCNNKRLREYSHEEFINLLKEKKNNTLYPIEKYVGMNTRILFKCNKSYYIPHVILHSHNNIGCIKCNNNFGKNVIKGINDLWTTDPEIAELLLDYEDGYKYSRSSNKKLLFKCPNCGNIKTSVLNNVSLLGYLSCNICGDGISIPEKFVSNFLSMNNINYKYDNATEWSNRKRYDFIINDDIIIETHGEQHYGNSGKFKGLTIEKQYQNDQYKKELALNNGIKYYIELDCRVSILKHLKNSILNSNIPKIFNLNLDNFNWNDCYKKTIKSKVVIASNLYDKGLTITEISKILKCHYTTISRYLERYNVNYHKKGVKKTKI